MMTHFVTIKLLSLCLFFSFLIIFPFACWLLLISGKISLVALAYVNFRRTFNKVALSSTDICYMLHRWWCDTQCSESLSLLNMVSTLKYKFVGIVCLTADDAIEYLSFWKFRAFGLVTVVLPTFFKGKF